jgi:SAM-dependent methyltransferase
MGIDLSKGWFKLPGIREAGDRTVEEQSLGLAPALAEAAGKTVLDLGCAEGALSKLFAEAGATSVLGIELLATHLAVARQLCKGVKNVSFVEAHLEEYINTKRGGKARYDIVLALGIIHKLDDPGLPLRFAARSCKDLLLYRASAHAVSGVIKGKHSQKECDVPKVLAKEGFREERLIAGTRGEAVQYWRRVR